MLAKDALGKRGEEIASKYLTDNNFAILERNWRFGRKEVDIIATKNNVLHFVEVKTRNLAIENIAEIVNKKKQQNITEAATEYIIQQSSNMLTVFDVITVSFENGKHNLEHIVDAFAPYE